MGNTDSIPVISQVKSLVQVMSGDAAGAKKTQQNFAETAPVVSQVTSFVHHARGNDDKAKAVQKKFVKSLDELSDGLPVVGHVKGAVYYATGDNERGERTMKSATGSAVSMAGGAAGFIVGGPVGAAAGSFAASSAYDGLVTGIDTAIHGEDSGRPRYYGSWESYDRIHQGKASSGEIFDAVGMPIIDAATAAVGVKFAKTKLGRRLKGSRGSKLRCAREAEYHLTSPEHEFATSHQGLPGSVNDILKSKWSHMSVPETVSNLVSLFIILRLILWNDKNGRTYSRELCSFVDDMAYIEKCQDSLMRTLRRMDDHLAETADDTDYVLDPHWLTVKSNDPNEVMIHVMATLYGILDSMGRGQKMGAQWAMQLCMYEDTDTYAICETETLMKLQALTSNAFSLGLTRQRRVKRAGKRCGVSATGGQKKKAKTQPSPSGRHIDVKEYNKQRPGRYESNHVPAASAYGKGVNLNDLPAHSLPYDVHQISMTRVGTSKNTLVARALRGYEADLIKQGKLAEAIKVDVTASYGRANVLLNKNGQTVSFKPALVEYGTELKDLVDVNRNMNKISVAEAADLITYIDDQVKVWNRNPKWDAWIDHIETNYEQIVKDNGLNSANRGFHVEQKYRHYG